MEKLIRLLLAIMSVALIIILKDIKLLNEELGFFKYEYHEMREVNKRLVRESYKVPNQFTSQDVIFTNYYKGDSTGSGSRTGSGLSIKDFEVNEKGWFTYEGFVVVATATNECLNSSIGACRSYLSVPEGFHIFNYFDTLTITVQGVDYPAIVLDSCGACFWENDYQKVDIFIKNSNYNFGRKKGTITWK